MLKYKFVAILLAMQSPLLAQQLESGINSEMLTLESFTSQYNDSEYQPYLFSYHEYEQINIGDFQKKYPIADTEMYTLFMVFSTNSADTICSVSTGNQLLVLENDQVMAEHPLSLEMDRNVSHLFMYSGGSGREVKEKIASRFDVGKTVGSTDEYVNLAEVSIFDRILSTKDKEVLGSRLAIKYGIPFPVDSVYYDSEHQIVFDPDQQGQHKYNVTILGNDIDLHNTQAVNVRSKVVKMGIGNILPKQAFVGDLQRRYLCISDNDEELAFNKKNLLQRTWKLSGDIDRFAHEALSVQIDMGSMYFHDPSYDYYLVGSTSKKFSPAETSELAKLAYIQNQFVCSSKSILSTRHSSYFTIARKLKSKKVDSDLTIDVPRLVLANSESQLKIRSNTAPISGDVTIYNINGYQVFHKELIEFSTIATTFFSLPAAGTYFLTFESDSQISSRKIIAQ